MLDVFVILFVGLMAFAWYRQGMFSSLIHLICTIVAGVLAFALWETMADLLPLGDASWGVGLLLPFAGLLYGLRILTNRIIAGYVDFHHLVNGIGGAIFGLASGILTMGLLVIGLQMTGAPSLFGYQSWVMGDGVEPKRKDNLWIPVDDLAAQFFTGLSTGSMAPLLGDATLASHHPDLVREAAFYMHPWFEPGSATASGNAGLQNRKTADSESITLLKEKGCMLLPAAPAKLTQYETIEYGQPKLKANQPTVIIGTEILVVGKKSAGEDGKLRIRQFQVALLYTDAAGLVKETYPHGFIQYDSYGSFAHGKLETVRNKSQNKETVRWVFQIPPKAKPMALRVKHQRFDLPDKPQEGPELVAMIDALVELPKPPDVEPKPVDMNKIAKVDARIPFVLNSNTLETSVKLQDEPGGREQSIVSGRGSGLKSQQTGKALRVTRINAGQNERIVRVTLGTRVEHGLLSRSLAMKDVKVNPAPILSTEAGETFKAIGYIVDSGASLKFNIDPEKPIADMSSVDVGTLSREDTLIFYYRLPKGAVVTHAQLGPDKFDFAPKMKAE